MNKTVYRETDWRFCRAALGHLSFQRKTYRSLKLQLKRDAADAGRIPKLQAFQNILFNALSKFLFEILLTKLKLYRKIYIAECKFGGEEAVSFDE